MSPLHARLSFYSCLVVMLLMSTGVFARPYSPKAGSGERKDILDALRVPAQKRARQPIVFHNVDIKVENGWAWTLAVARDKSGKKLPLGDLMTCGLLRKINGRWTVLHWGVAGDITIACDAKRRYPQAPRGIFGGVIDGC